MSDRIRIGIAAGATMLFLAVLSIAGLAYHAATPPRHPSAAAAPAAVAPAAVAPAAPRAVSAAAQTDHEDWGEYEEGDDE